MSAYSVKKESTEWASGGINGRYSRRSSATLEREAIPWSKNEISPVHEGRSGLTWGECIFQIFSSIQGPTIFILPSGLKKAGYLPGIVSVFAAGVFYLHMMQIYLWCEKELRKRRDIAEETHLSIYSMVDLIFVDFGKITRISRYLIVYLKCEIILSWSVSLSFNGLFVCQNTRLILNYFGYTAKDGVLLLAMFPITTLVSFVPDLKVMSVIAYSSTLVLIVNMFAIFYFIGVDPAAPAPITMFGDPSELFIFLPTTLFTINCTPLMFHLKQEMRKPKQFGSLLGSLNVSIFVFIAVNLCFSMLAYMKYGNATQDNLTENLPRNLLTTLSNCLLTGAVVVCGAITFFVIFETVWRHLAAVVADSRYSKLYEYVTRTFINLLITVMALIIPSLDLFILLISSFSYPYDSIFLPALLQSMLLWSDGKRSLRCLLVIVKNILLLVTSVAFSGVMLAIFADGMSNAYMTQHVADK